MRRPLSFPPLLFRALSVGACSALRSRGHRRRACRDRFRPVVLSAPEREREKVRKKEMDRLGRGVAGGVLPAPVRMQNTPYWPRAPFLLSVCSRALLFIPGQGGYRRGRHNSRREGIRRDRDRRGRFLQPPRSLFRPPPFLRSPFRRVRSHATSSRSALLSLLNPAPIFSRPARMTGSFSSARSALETNRISKTKTNSKTKPTQPTTTLTTNKARTRSPTLPSFPLKCPRASRPWRRPSWATAGRSRRVICEREMRGAGGQAVSGRIRFCRAARIGRLPFLPLPGAEMAVFCFSVFSSFCTLLVAQVGDHVIAVGHPFGLTHTVTLGVISAPHRRCDL